MTVNTAAAAIREIKSVIEERCHHRQSATCKVYERYRHFYQHKLGAIKALGQKKTKPLLKALTDYLMTDEEYKAEKALNRIVPKLSQEDRSILYGTVIAGHLEEFSAAALNRLQEIVGGFIPEMDDLRIRNLVCGICIQWKESGKNRP